jgi:CIC family chloride channel protein
LLPVAIGSVAATVVGRWAFGPAPAFDVPALAAAGPATENPLVFLVFALFAMLVGGLAALFVRGIYWTEDRFDAMPGNYYTRHMLGMLLVGGIMYLFLWQAGNYYVQGVGYATIEDILHGRLTVTGFLLLLVGAKLIVTFLTLGSGASGGVFSPCLYLGATFGAAYGQVAVAVLPRLGMSAIPFAVVGMAAMVGASTGAVLTVIVMVFEMTRDYSVILPVILCVAAAHQTRKALCPESIYTLKLVRRGHLVEEGLRHDARASGKSP